MSLIGSRRAAVLSGGGLFSPFTFGKNLVGFYDATDVTTLFQDSALTTPVAADTDPVGGWLDKSSAGNHIVQATAGKRPLYRTGVVNGLPGIRSDGVDDFLTKSFTFNQPCSIYVLGRLVAAPAASAIAVGGILASAGNEIEIGVGTAPSYFLYAGGGVVGTIATNTSPHVVGGVFSGAASVRDYDGTRLAVSPGTNHPQGISVGACADASHFCNFDACIVILVNRALAGAEQARLCRYLGARGGVAVA